jgi:hypothetical protein
VLRLKAEQQLHPIMKQIRRYPEIFVEADYLTVRDDLIRGVIKVRSDTYKVILDHPVFGMTIEIMELDPEDNTLCLRSIFPTEMQSEEEMESVKDYYRYLLDGEDTYIDYYNPEFGYFLLSRNIGMYPASTYSREND